MRIAWFLLFAVTAIAQTAGSDQTGGVSGMVTDAVTHLPVKKTTVTVMAMGGAGRIQEAHATTTDSSGTFSIGNLQAGKHRLMFVQQNYPQARFGGVSKTVEVKAGETAGPVTVELMPGAVVTGHIVDEDGDPIPNCRVELDRPKNSGGISWMGGPSNEDGEYRLYQIAPGKYILSAQCGRPVFQPRPFSSGPDPPPSTAYPPQYYPLTNDAKAAQMVELAGGTEKTGVDFQMSPAAVTQIRGAFSPAGADSRKYPVAMQLVPLDDRGRNRGVMNPNVDQAKGTFELPQVFPGSYILTFFSQGGDQDRIGAQQRVDVGDRPVELTIELRHAIDISGRLEIDSSGNSTNKVIPNQIQIVLTSPNQRFGMPGSQTQASEDGTFILKGVMPAPWRLRVNGPAVFIKSAWLGSTDVTDAPMDLSAGAAGALRIVIGTNTATIRGSAPAGYTINLQTIDEEVGFRSMRGAQADQSGQYKFDGLAPGKYRLMLVDSNGPIPEDGGQEVIVREGETLTVDLKAP
jgi:hypothetical protein